MSAHERAVRAFIGAFNSQDLDTLAALLTPDVEVVTPRGVKRGPVETVEWARSNPDGALVQRLEIDSVLEGPERVLVDIRRQWHWRDPEHGGLADESPLTLIASFRDALIARWEPYEDRATALAALELAAGETT